MQTTTSHYVYVWDYEEATNFVTIALKKTLRGILDAYSELLTLTVKRTGWDELHEGVWQNITGIQQKQLKAAIATLNEVVVKFPSTTGSYEKSIDFQVPNPSAPTV